MMQEVHMGGPMRPPGPRPHISHGVGSPWVRDSGSFLCTPQDGFRPPMSSPAQFSSTPMAAPMAAGPIAAGPPFHPGFPRPWPPDPRPVYPQENHEDSWNPFSWGDYGEEDERAEPVSMPLPAHLRFISASVCRQHPHKTEMGAINADVAEEAPTFLGICDGVSEVQKLGISPDDLPSELLGKCREAAEEREARLSEGSMDSRNHYPASSSWIVNLIKDSYRQTKALGSTTLLLALIEENNRLMVANLGDCCGLLLRRNVQRPQVHHVVYKTEQTRYEHNKPFQVVRLDGVEESQIAAVINSTRVDAVTAQHGDLLVLGSDGLFDNLHDEDIIRVVSKCCPPRYPASQNQQMPRQMQQPVWGLGAHQLPLQVPSVRELNAAADALVQEAFDCVCKGSVDETTGAISWPPHARQTPAGLGGKADDTTAIVAAIVEVSDPVAHEEFFYKVHPNQRRQGWFDHGCCGQNSADRCRCS